MVTKRRLSTEDWEAEVGRQIRRARLAADVDQRSLASAANISVGALQHLEHGDGATLRTLIRAVRALGLEDWLAGLSPAPEVSPLALLRARDGEREPRRASPRRSGAEAKRPEETKQRQAPRSSPREEA